MEVNESKLPADKVFVEEMRSSSVGVRCGYIGTSVSLPERVAWGVAQAESNNASPRQV